MERRVLIAITLSFLVLFLFQRFVMPPAPGGGGSATAPSATATPSANTPTAEAPKAEPGTSPTTAAAAPTPAVASLGEISVGGEAERTITVETTTVRAVFTNRGARLLHWVLKAYRAEDGSEVDLVPAGPGATATKPFSLAVDDPAQTQVLNQSLYRIVGVLGDVVQASAEAVTIQFELATAGGLTAHKTFTLRPQGYVASVGVAVKFKDQPLNPQIHWGPGLSDDIAREKPASFLAPSYNTPAQVIVHKDGSAERVASSTSGAQDGAFLYAGINDQYFASLLLNDRSAPKPFHLEYAPVLAPYGSDPAAVAHYESYSVRIATPAESLQFFVGPKAFDELRAIDPELVRVINFGMFSWLAVPLLGALKWVHGFVGNWGWSIVVLTILINLAMFPLRHKSVVSMRKMQELQPQMKAIQDRYAKFKITDPERQKMNSEVMELYKTKGVNPASGCVPMLLTLPFLFAFYSMLSQAIEIRGADFFGWITDLSRHDPLFITPVLMGVTMFWQQKMTPSSMDPAQQKVMMFMPVMFLFMFLWAPSGLVIYWFISNLWAIGQQYLTSYLIGPAPALKAAK
jgi:YidC/Oxa1 family membrane protein insertase